MKLLLPLALVASTTSAVADSTVRLFTPGRTLLLEINDETGELAQLVGDKKTGAVRCYSVADNVQARAGAGDVIVSGCYTTLRRDGTFGPPPSTAKPWSLSHMSGFNSGDAEALANKDGSITVRTSGAAANAIALWVDCADKRGALTCEQDNGMAGQYTWEVWFTVAKNGRVRVTK